MGTIHLREELKDVKPASRAAAGLLPKSDVGTGTKFARRPMSGIRKTEEAAGFCHHNFLHFELHGHRRDVDGAAGFHREPAESAVTHVLGSAPPPPPPPPPPAAEQVRWVVRQIQTDLLNTGQLRTPRKIPQKVQMIHEEEAPLPMPARGRVE